MWFLYSQLSALTESMQLLASKKATKNLDALIVTLYSLIVSVPILVAITVVFENNVVIKEEFYPLLIARIVLDTVALSMYMKAIEKGELSYVTPLFAFSAVFSTLFSAVINLEVPTVAGLMGILIIVAGTYILNTEEEETGILTPIRKLFTLSASKLMLGSAVLYALIYAISKPAIDSSGILTYTTASAIGLLITFTLLNLFINRSVKKVFKFKYLKNLWIIGAIDSLKIIFLMITISLSFVGFADAANNTSIIYTSTGAFLFFGESFKGKLLPIVMMFVGVFLLTV